MAKPPTKNPKPNMPTEPEAVIEPVADQIEDLTPALESGGAKAETTQSTANTKKDPVKPKKPVVTKTSSLLPSQQKLDHLKAAVLAAGNPENLITILNHVEDAGGRKDVLDSIEAYKVLKTVLEDM
jgi:hypothetical protein